MNMIRMVNALRRMPQFTGKTVLIFILLLAVGGCQVIGSTQLPTTEPPTPVPPTAVIPTPILITPTSTPISLALPFIIHSPENTPAATTVSPLNSTPTDQLLQTAAPQAAEITLLFTGVIVPARCVQSAIDARGDANYVYDEVRDLISGADLAVGTLNTTLSDLSTHTGCIVTYVLLSDSRSAKAAGAAGFDVMSVATNHIKNCSGASCGDNYNRAFFDTLDNLRANNIQPVGAGMNQEDALQTVLVEVKGVRFGFVSLGMVEPNAFAGEDSPGIAQLTDENLRAAIANARSESDVVIAMPHWGPEDTSEPNSYQLHFAQVAVEAGADVVVGNHTHVVQAIQQLNGIDVFYGLGNFVFDQTWDLAHQQGVILQLHFSGSTYQGYDLIPTHVDGNGTVHIAGAAEAEQVLQRIEDASAARK
jgi:poly-gamma-glutamate capsule biosynthesis protein CapA/YwtB (metallophosphatase superfamily)